MFRVRAGSCVKQPACHLGSSTDAGHCAPWDGGWPLPTAGGRRSKAPSDQTCLLQSVQKTKISKPICGRLERFQEAVRTRLSSASGSVLRSPRRRRWTRCSRGPTAPAYVMFQSTPSFASLPAIVPVALARGRIPA